MRFAFLISPTLGLLAGAGMAEDAGRVTARLPSGLSDLVPAQSQAPVQSPRPKSDMPPLPAIECYCTDRTGGRVELGETICLMVDGRAYLARCEMSLNVPAWRDTGSDCVGA